MPPRPLRRLVRAKSSSSTDSQQTKAGSSQAPAPESLASTSLAQAAKTAAAKQAAGTAAAGPLAAAAVQLLKPQSQSQSQPQPGGNARLMQSDLSAQYVGEYQEQPDEEDVDILEDSYAVSPTLDTQQPAADEAVPHAGIAGAAGNGAAEAGVLTHDVAGPPAGAGDAPVEDAAKPLPTSRL